MRARARAALASALVLLLAGCGFGVPESGPVVSATPHWVQPNPGIRIFPGTPDPDAGPSAVIEAFMVASATAEDNDYTDARRYLTPQASAAWDPAEGLRVYESGATPYQSGERVLLDAGLVGELSDQGAYRVISGTVRHDFGMMRDDSGAWRIAKPPSGLLISEALFEASYRRTVPYFWARGHEWLVPDPRYFRRGPKAREGAARAVLTGPTSWLAPAVEPAAGPRLVGVRTTPRANVEIEISQEGTPLDDAGRLRLVTALAWTFREFPYLATLSVREGGQNWRIPGADDDRVDLAGFASASPVAPDTSEQLFAVVRGRIARLGGAGQDRIPVAPGVTDVSSLAVRADAAQAAVVTADRSALWLTAVATEHRERSLAAPELGRPHYSRQGELWVPQSGGVRVLADGRWSQVQVGGAPAGDVGNLRVSPDGARMLVVVRRPAGTSVVGVARIVRAPGQPPRLDGWQELPSVGRLGNPIDAGWLSGQQVIVLVHDAGQSTTVRLELGGPSVAVLGPAGIHTEVELAVAPGVSPIVRESSGQLLRLGAGQRWLPYGSDVTTMAYPG